MILMFMVFSIFYVSISFVERTFGLGMGRTDGFWKLECVQVRKIQWNGENHVKQRKRKISKNRKVSLSLLSHEKFLDIHDLSFHYSSSSLLLVFGSFPLPTWPVLNMYKIYIKRPASNVPKFHGIHIHSDITNMFRHIYVLHNIT